MSLSTRRSARVLVIAFATILAASPVLAEKGGNGHGHKKDRDESSDRDDSKSMKQDGNEHRSERFDDNHRVAVRDYYDHGFKSGRCPPGLAKKHNGCMPPGQARKWELNRPLPRDVVLYEVPRPLVLQLGLPPQGYRYVRVASDILLIAVGTSLVVDAIADLGR